MGNRDHWTVSHPGTRYTGAMTSPGNDVSTLLQAWSAGDATALDKLTPIVYGELRRLASRYMKGERDGHSLQTTALVNEAWLRLVDIRQIQWQNLAHFFAVSAQLMRRILVDYARRHNLKRGGDLLQVSLHDEGPPRRPSFTYTSCLRRPANPNTS